MPRNPQPLEMTAWPMLIAKSTRAGAQYADMSDLDQTVLIEQFVAARERAITLTDRFRMIDVDDPGRGKLWEHVMRQTDTAKLLLERWLRSGS